MIKLKILLPFVLLIIILLSVSCNSNSSVKIGEQEWSSKNLDVSTFRNGDTIHEIKSYDEFAHNVITSIENRKSIPAWCYYNFDKKNGALYGKLYNYAALNDPRGLAPQGWHIPTGDEVEHLYYYLGYLGAEESGNKLKSKNGWFENGNGSNISGFNALPGGYVSWNGCQADFVDVGKTGIWYCTSPYQFFYLISNSDHALLANKPNDIFWRMHVYYCSVRCIKDK